MAKYQGHKNWNHWNVSLWIHNDETLYNWALAKVEYFNRLGKSKDVAAKDMWLDLQEVGLTHTPDGAPYSVSSIRAAMAGM